MHVLHQWLVEAEDREDAFHAVSGRLSNEDGDKFVEWSDWHVIGGGRWSDSTYEDSSDMIVNYYDSPKEFDKIIDDIRESRRQDMGRIWDKINTDQFRLDIEEYTNAGELVEKGTDMNNYYISRATDLMEENYTSNSYFYDLINYTASMRYMKADLYEKDSAKLFLVPIDFHH